MLILTEDWRLKITHHLFHVSKINGELVENVEDLDIVIPMYSLLEYSKNYEKTSGALFNYYRDEPNEAEIANGNGAINISIRNSESFDYKTKIVGTLMF